MDFVSPILDIVARLWDCTAKNSAYIRHLRENLDSLRDKKTALDRTSEDVFRRVDYEERFQYSVRTNQVKIWMEKVEQIMTELDNIMQKGDQEMQKKCFGGCCPRNCFSSHKLGKEVIKKLNAVTELINQGNFNVVTLQPLRTRVGDELPIEETVGMTSIFREVWRCIEDDSLEIIGIYGIGGVGKTTLLKKLNNKILKTGNFDLVIWGVASKEVNVEKIQKLIRDKLCIPDELWELKYEDARAMEIFTRLRSRKFVLLLDDLWERIDLSKVGVPGNQKGSKIIFTTRLEEVCGHMEADKGFRVECLSPEFALYLFRRKVGEDVLNSHPEIPRLAEIVAKECKGLPLALITIGRAMASRRTVYEWQHTVTVLKSYPSKFSGMGNLVFPTLKYSYDNLSDNTLKACFLYCSFFPEDYDIRKDELIELWIGEGLLDDFSNIYDARNQGEYIIGSLKIACLLERGEQSEDFVKMHDVLRDMAIWLASEENQSTILAQDHAKTAKLTTKGYDKLDGTLRLWLWGSSFDALPDELFCSRLQSFLARLTVLETFPSSFFNSMNSLIVLDLSYNLDLKTLPVGIGCLINLKYLNLSNTNIQHLPVTIQHLINLRILLLDGTRSLQSIPTGIISSLSSLQVFSWLSTTFSMLHDQPLGDTGLLEELESLEYMNDISVTLFTIDSVLKLESSPKLQSCIKRLTIVCWELISLYLPSTMVHLETLNISDCLSLERVNIYFENAGRSHASTLHNLRYLVIKNSPIKNLTWLLQVPSLQNLSLESCPSLNEIIACDFGSSDSEIVGNLNIFPNLLEMDLFHLPSLKSICCRGMHFPSLETIQISGCPCLIELPLNCNIVRSGSKVIRARRIWSNLSHQTELEDEYYDSDGR